MRRQLPTGTYRYLGRGRARLRGTELGGAPVKIGLALSAQRSDSTGRRTAPKGGAA